MIKPILIITLLISFAFANVLSKETFTTLQEVEKLLDASKIKEAKALLNKNLESDISDYERSYLYQSLASCFLEEENQKKAIFYYQEILRLKTFKEKQLNNISLTLAQLYLYDEKFQESKKILLSLTDVKDINLQRVYESLSIATYYLEEFSNTIIYGNKYLTFHKENENIFKILYSSYIQENDYLNAIATMEQMVRIWSEKEEYWATLASLYANQQNTSKALDILTVAYGNNLISKKENIIFYANLAFQRGLYMKTYKVLKEAMKKEQLEMTQEVFTTIVGALSNAKEDDLLITEIENSIYFNDPQYRLTVAQTYYKQLQFTKSLEILHKTETKEMSQLEADKLILTVLNYLDLDKKEQSIKFLKLAIKNSHSKIKAESIIKQLGLEAQFLN